MGCGMSNITEHMVATDVAMALDNHASAAMSKTDALDTLMAINKQLSDALAHVTKENEKLLTMVCQMTTDAMKQSHTNRALQIVIVRPTALS